MGDPNVGIWSREIPWDGPAIREWFWKRRVAILALLGIGFRVAQFLAGRNLWMDESSLVANARMPSPLAFFGPLANDQLAPPGFLLAEWLSLRVVTNATYGARLVPLLAGIAAIGLFLAVARRILPARAVPVAVAMFASADDLIYFSAEAKQYSSDVAAALAVTLLALTVGRGTLTARSMAILATSGAAIVWFSHPSAFVLAAAGTVRLLGRLRARDWRGAAGWCLIGLFGVASIAALHSVAMEQLGHRGMMWDFWDFAFPPMPPRSAWDASWIARHLAYVFVNPLHFSSPFGPRWTMVLALGLWLVGIIQLFKIDRATLGIILLPIGFALAASSLRLYPFHGRLILFLVPSFLMAMAAGLDRTRDVRPGGRILFAVLAGVVIVVPMAFAFGHLFEPRNRINLNPHGDRRPIAVDPYRYPW